MAAHPASRPAWRQGAIRVVAALHAPVGAGDQPVIGKREQKAADAAIFEAATAAFFHIIGIAARSLSGPIRSSWPDRHC